VLHLLLALALGSAEPTLHSRGSGGAVAAAEPEAVAAGIAMLARGGNAVDAAVATALALAVVFPQAGNLGGGGFAVVRIDGQVHALDFRETAPAAATADMYLAADGSPRPEASLVGPLSAGVPGSPAGLHELHRRFGRMPWRRVVEPAIRLAVRSFVVSERLHDETTSERALLATFPETAAVWLPGGAPPPAGATMKLAELAATLRAYAEHGPDAIQQGAVARAIETASRAHGGILTAADLAAYRPVWREPVRFRLAGFELASMPLPSSGGLILAETSALLERAGWAARPKDTAIRAHTLVESFRLAYADRFLLGDPAAVRVSAAALLDPARLAARAGAIGERATASAAVEPGAGTSVKESVETTHLSVIDGKGNAVALTTTLNGSFGSGLYVPGAGFLLNNEMDDFTTAPGKPNTYGLVQGKANAVAPGKRMLSSMSPTIAWRGDEVLALGSPGGSQIPSGVLQVLLRTLVDRDSLERAIAAPRIHHQWLPDEIVAEPGALDPTARAELEARGHRLRLDAASTEVHAVRQIRRGELEAVADPRGPGAAAVVRPRSAKRAVD
jgi:gamma-glutamyltranspeptidase/glutathione hydrolase